MISVKNKFKTRSLLMAVIILVLTACNKDPEEIAGITPADSSGLSIAETLATIPTYSLFNKIVVKGGMAAALGDKSLTYTLFALDNDAMIASFGGSEGSVNATIAALPPASWAGIVKYLMIPQKLTSAQIVHGFPNMQMPTDIVLDPTNSLVRMTSFPSKNPSTNAYYFNNVPVTAVDMAVANGIIHQIAFLSPPPRMVLKSALDTNTNLNYFRAAIARADIGQTGLNRFDSLLNYAVTNMTVLAPSDAAFQTLIFGLAFQGYLSSRPMPYTATDTANAVATGNGAVAAGPAFLSTNNVSTDLVRGIIAYHLLATPNPSTSTFEPNIRVFSVNFSPTPSFVTTLVNSAFAHPGIMVNATFTGPFVTDLKFTGVGPLAPSGIPFNGTPATAISLDNHAVNGVYYVIDHVLLPQ